MEIELQEIRNYIAESLPFSLLNGQELDQLVEQFQIRYLRRGSPFPPEDREGRFLYLVRSGAIEIRDREQVLLNKLAEQDYYSNCLTIEQDEQQGRAIEDTLLYQLPCREVRALCDSSIPFDEHFSASLSKRIKQAVSRVQQSVDSGMAHMTVEVEQLLKRPPVCMPDSSTIQQVAEQMAKQKMSSMILTSDQQLSGIVTDRDLRSRCVAIGRDVSEPVRTIMTNRIEAIEHNDLALNALMTMTRMNVHHLPVMREGEIAGMITATDLAHHNSSNPAFIMSDIRKAQTLDELVMASKRLPELQVQLNNAHVTALHMGDMISRIVDAITVRLIEMRIKQHGEAPVEFVWVVGGSQARREQTSHSDQDNALILSDEYNDAEHGGWFEQLATWVTDGLNACGFVYCPGEAMASNPKWRQPLATWRRYFDEWINRPEPMALMLSSIFFDLRPVYGEHTLFESLQRETLQHSQGATIFTAHMASNALKHRPPLGFFRRFVLIHDGEHNDTFDIKHRGIVPITDIARLLSLSEGLTATNTMRRLEQAAERNALSEEMCENLQDALSFIAELRIQHQAEQIRKGVSPDNYLPPHRLSELDRKHLKDAFNVIQEMQESIELRYQTGRLG